MTLRESLHYAFQPIVNVHTGEAFGFEALLRGTEAAGFDSIAAYFDDAARRDASFETGAALFDLAARELASFAAGWSVRLFFNLDARLLAHPARLRASVDAATPGALGAVLEVRETDRLDDAFARELETWIARPLIAIDNFGTGLAGLRLIADRRADMIKIDRTFVAGVDVSQARHAFLGQIVGLAHANGLVVIAAGVETEAEFVVCRDVGCDYVQGFFIARPTSDRAALLQRYDPIEAVNRRTRHDRRDVRAAAELRAELDPVTPLRIDAPMEAVLDAFRHDGARSFFPVVSERHEPLGIVHEEQLKELIYSPFGRSLLTNRVQPHRLSEFLSPCLTFDVTTGIERILSAIAGRPNDHAVLISERGRYVGLLDTRGIIRTMHDRMLALARDENPLTRLPGNVMVANHLAESIESDVRPLALIHFDLDHFKPFNDRFGFRIGDRAITMFAEAMRAMLAAPDVFLGHIGGDDFFVAAHGPAVSPIVAALPRFVEEFRSDAESFYDEATRHEGTVEIVDRNGTKRRVPLLSVSCACFIVTAAGRVTLDGVTSALVELKHIAKSSNEKIAIATDEVSVPA